MFYECIKDFQIEIYDEHGFSTCEYSTVKSGSKWERDDDTDIIGGDVHLDSVDGLQWIEVSNDTLSDYFKGIGLTMIDCGITENEVIKVLKKNFPKTCKMINGRYKGGFDDTDCIFGKALLLAISSLEEIQQYKAIGTVEEIKEILQIISEGQEDVDKDGISTGLLHTLLKYAEYAKIGTIEECREARERQNPKKPITYKGTNRADCPICGNIVKGIAKPFGDWCSHCGYKLDWSE